MGKPILCLDFDGVIHSYSSGWKGASVVPDPPVPGAMAFICEAVRYFKVAIYSSRSGQNGGLGAMQGWLISEMMGYLHGAPEKPELEQARSATAEIMKLIEWPTEKPAAMVTLDDRAITFTGTWPAMDTLLTFQPWNKRA